MWLHFLHNYYHARWLMLPVITIPIECISAANGCTRSYRFRLTESTHMREHIKFHNLDGISFCSITLDAYVHTINIMILWLPSICWKSFHNKSIRIQVKVDVMSSICRFYFSFHSCSWFMEKQYKMIRYTRLIPRRTHVSLSWEN